MTQIYTKEYMLLKIVSQSIAFAKEVIWPYDNPNLSLATTKEELLEIFRLRSRIYKKLDYKKEFPDPIEGYDFDRYDTHAAIFYTHSSGKITGTCRIIFDSESHLPIDENFSLHYLRKNKRLAELSRFIIDEKVTGLSPEFKLLIKGMYGIISSNSIDMAVSVIAKNHFRFYEKVGGFKKETELQTYGALKNPHLITTWDTKCISAFFKRAFLQEKHT